MEKTKKEIMTKLYLDRDYAEIYEHNIVSDCCESSIYIESYTCSKCLEFCSLINLNDC